MHIPHQYQTTQKMTVGREHLLAFSLASVHKFNDIMLTVWHWLSNTVHLPQQKY